MYRRPDNTAAALVRAAKERLAARQAYAPPATATPGFKPPLRPLRPPGVSRRQAAAWHASLAMRAPAPEDRMEPALPYLADPLPREYPEPEEFPAPVAVPTGTARGGDGAALHPRQSSVSTWTVQMGEVPISYVSRDSWHDQPRPERGSPLDAVPEPFHRCTLEERHPNEPKATYSKEELDDLCPLCGTLVLHWDTHKAGNLHYENARKKEAAKAAAVGNGPAESATPTQTDVIAALRVLQATRPEIIAASLQLALPGALKQVQQAASHGPQRTDGHASQPAIPRDPPLTVPLGHPSTAPLGPPLGPPLAASLNSQPGGLRSSQRASGSSRARAPSPPRRNRWSPEGSKGSSYKPSSSSNGRPYDRPSTRRDPPGSRRSPAKDRYSKGHQSSSSRPSGYWR